MTRRRLSAALVVLALLGASCATQPAAEGDATETLMGPRDFSGIWLQASGGNLDLYLLLGEEIALTPYGAERYRTVDQAAFPGNTCLPYGPNRGMASTNPFMVVQTSEVIAVLTEHIDYRIFYMDGRDHPDDILDYPEWMGHSIGRWENDTLVVDTIGLRPETWLDRGGLQHSDQMHLIERFEKTGADTITWTVTVDDPVFFTKPWTYQRDLERLDFPRLLPARCADGEVDVEHMLPVPGATHETPPTFPEE
jgi:hypothetical protein